MFLASGKPKGILLLGVELRHLRYFVAAAEAENLSRAALKLHVSQPALGRQIRDLEDEIGFCLLERTAKSVRLTDAGRAGTGVAFGAEIFGYSFGNRLKRVRLIPEPKPLSIGIAALRGRLSPAAENSGSARKKLRLNDVAARGVLSSGVACRRRDRRQRSVRRGQ